MKFMRSHAELALHIAQSPIARLFVTNAAARTAFVGSRRHRIDEAEVESVVKSATVSANVDGR